MQRVPLVIHGLMGVLPFISKGTRDIDRLVDALPQQDSRDFLQIDLKGALAYVEAQRKKHGKIELLICGHSMGCYRAIQVAEWARKEGILVRYIAAIDPTAINRLFGMKPMVVPENVAEVEEFWAAFGFPATARVASPTGMRGGRYIIPAGWPGRHRLHSYAAEHIALASKPEVVKIIVDRFSELMA